MFAGVIEVEDLDGIREGEAGVFPNARGTIANEDEPFGMVESSPMGFLMEQDGDLTASLVGIEHSLVESGSCRGRSSWSRKRWPCAIA